MLRPALLYPRPYSSGPCALYTQARFLEGSRIEVRPCAGSGSAHAERYQATRAASELVFRTVLLTLLLVAGIGPARAGGPMLAVDLGQHDEDIRHLLADDAGRFLVSAGDQPVLRVWDLLSGGLIQTIWLPRTSDSSARLTAAALSPDGRYIACGLMDAGSGPSPASHSLLLLERAGRRVLHRLEMPSEVASLSFLADSGLVAVALARGGVMLHDVQTGGERARAHDDGPGTLSLSTDRRGNLVALGADRKLSLYRGALELIHATELPAQGQLVGVKLSPDGSRVAVGYHGSPRIEIYGSDLKLLGAAPVAAGETGELTSFDWSQANALYVSWSPQGGRSVIRKLSQGGLGPAAERDTGAARCTAMAVLAQDSVAHASNGPSLRVLGANGRALLSAPRASAELVGGALRVDRDGTRVHFAVRRGPPGKEVVQASIFSVDTRTLQPASDVSAQATAEPASALPIPPSDRMRQPAALARVQSGDGRIVVAAFTDGTLRWYTAAGSLLLSLTLDADGKKWVAWTPSGYFDCSAGGDELLGWVVPRGGAALADFFPVSLLRKHLHRPEIVARSLLPKEAADTGSSAGAQPTENLSLIRTLLPPVVSILSPSEGAGVSNTEVMLQVAVRSPSGEPITGLRALVQGRMAEQRGIALSSGSAPQLSAPDGSVHQIRLTIPEEDCTLAVLAETAYSRSAVVLRRIRWQGARNRPQPTLYVLAVGTSRYQQDRLDLLYPAKDARDLAAALTAQQGRIYRRVEVRTLTDQGATRDNILSGLAWLRQQTTERDVAVFFLAGHGVNDASSGRYYYLPHEADLERPAETLIEAGQIQLFLSTIRGKAILFLDTCHAGNVLQPAPGAQAPGAARLVADLASVDSGVVVFTASTGAQVSGESARWKNGAFTLAAVEGLRGKADYRGNGRITVSALEYYISERVAELTKGAQTPTTAKPKTVPDLLLALSQPRRPLHMRKAFWGGLLGGLTAVAAIAAGTAVLLSRDPATDGGIKPIRFP